VARKFSTSSRINSDCRASSDAEFSTSVAETPVSVAAEVTTPIFSATSRVPSAASLMLCAICRVAAFCCSTAPATSAEMLLISPMVLQIALIAPAAVCV